MQRVRSDQGCSALMAEGLRKQAKRRLARSARQGLERCTITAQVIVIASLGTR